MSKEFLDLLMLGRSRLSIDIDSCALIRDELEKFLDEEDYMNERKFAEKVMFSQEVKSNNLIEGITDDLLLIENVINNPNNIKDKNVRKRIINLYNGYKYILNNTDIDERHLKELYAILSDGLLTEGDLARMGDIYRTDTVYILKSGRLDIEPDRGIPHEVLDTYMKEYFDYVNSDNLFGNSMTDEFIKSQIMHFYFVYIHPFFDVNGRTSRTMAMWYLLNKEAYPYIIFNRAIPFEAAKYDKAIMDTRTFTDMSFFVRYMMENVKRELEKEMLMHQIKESTPFKLESIDYQSLIYLLSMKGEINVLTFASMYKRFNDSKPIKEIYEKMILPLLDKGIIDIIRVTNKEMFDGLRNEVFVINPSRCDKNSPKIKRLNMEGK